MPNWGKILSGIGAVAGIPFTGGASLTALLPSILGTVGTIAGGAAGGSAKSQSDKSQLDLQQNNQRNQQLLELFRAQQGAQFDKGGLDLQRKGFNESSEAARMKRALIGQLLGNMQDVQMTGKGLNPVQFSGGMRPSALGADGQAIAKLMSSRALESAKAGNTYEGGELLQSPQLSNPVNIKTGGNSLLNALGLAGSLAGGIGKTAQGQSRPWAPQMGGVGATKNPWDFLPDISMGDAPQG